MGTEYLGVPCLFVVDAVEQAVLCNDAEVAIGLNRHGGIACSCRVSQEQGGSEFVGGRLHRAIAGSEEQPVSKHCCYESAGEQ